MAGDIHWIVMVGAALVAVWARRLIAQGMIVEAQAGGMKVPDQLAVTGFGNLRLAGDMRPTITSVDVDGATVAGRHAIEPMAAFENRRFL